MKLSHSGSFYIQVEKIGKTKKYNYLMDVMLSQEEAATALSTEESEGVKKIEISKSAYYLALLRVYPQTESEVEEIISYSKGNPVELSLFEKIYLWIKR